ncbi:unnamed protein product [Nesidiocoris tenuis]|uniref:Uncharacterized protein n=1 Tax=Nesidiocoris tenuis TaxID=355587 RepID=A0A6H5H635_9HEMI|nr:unnamed protein product [Nesidiocoris tenuis]
MGLHEQFQGQIARQTNDRVATSCGKANLKTFLPQENLSRPVSDTYSLTSRAGILTFLLAK